MGGVRPFVEEDIPQVADLHCRVFNTGDPSSLQIHRAYRAYFSEIFLRHPWRDETIPSLIYQESNGRITGFLGVMPRRMMMGGCPIQAAVSSQFIVEPATRSTLAGVQLMKAFASGPQDLSLTDEANCLSRRLWAGLGGSTALLYSLYWSRVLSPGRFALSLLRKRGLQSAIAGGAAPLCRVIDAASARMAQSPLRLRPSSLSGEELSEQMLLACLEEYSRDQSLYACYDAQSLGWLLDILARKKAHGRFQKVLLRKPTGEIAGWYLYYANPGGVGEVIQVGARQGSISGVLDHLFYDAWKQGTIALSGRLEPKFLREFSEKGCLFLHRGYWLLIQTKSPELSQAIQRGDAFLTRLEGEWGLRFEAEADDAQPATAPHAV